MFIKRHPVLAAVVVALAVVLVGVIAMALTGPRIGSVFSSITNALDSSGSSSDYYAASQSEGEYVADGLVLASNTVRQERVILKAASVSLTVSDPQTRLSEISAMADEMGGWVVTSGISRYTNSAGEEVARGSITVRIPADRLNEALDRIKAGAIKVNSENVSGQDVTQQYVDLSSRLKNLEAAEKQLQTIMDAAKKVEDVLAVYNQLVSTRGEIESIKGQLQYFDEASEFSSIQIDLYPEEPGPVQAQTTGWNPASTAESALGALVSVVRAAVDVVIAAVVFFGPLAVVIGAVWMMVRTVRRRRQQA